MMSKSVALNQLSLATQQQLRQKGWRYFVLVIAMQVFFMIGAALLQLF